ncbi:sialate O-acetylesterase isoform X2 [Hyla sarda]|uniref:sialate O-acetylesterase isoform X2 n=1 Tax=Hyla sarda TaxID=327740 RepID=UPI0024C40861|nr:sialate O-acetylesterase isoform X2 [Hyla sarda]
MLLRVSHILDAVFRFASYYGDHMVLQQKPARAVVWGYAEMGALVTVTLKRGIDTISKTPVNVYGDVGVWKVVLDPMDYGGPYYLIAQQTFKNNITTIVLEDVLFGDVWVCGGQSNMEMTVSQIFNASQEMALAAQYPYVRLFTASLETSDTELLDLTKVDLEWSLPTPENLGHGDFQYFSAVCWIFGRHLAQKLKYPIGLVESVWGGTPVEAWSSKTALSKCGLSLTPTENKRCYNFMERYAGPCDYSVLWNAMIHPLLNMTIKGAIWYQGEQNTVTNPSLYNCTFPALIQDWRRSFHEGSLGQTDPNFPFGFVQLSTYIKTQPKDNYPLIRWHQTADYGYTPNPKMPNTFMAVAMDLGDESSPYGSVHPRDKQTVAYRLYLGAQAIAYGDHRIPFQGPFPETVDIYYNYSYMNITYNQELLITRTCDDIFEVLCSSGIDLYGESLYSWVPAPAQSPSSKVVTVAFKGCSHILAVRYAWSDWPCDYKQCPIYSVRGRLPAPIFVKYFE